jgi:hypothetical protein
MSIRKLRAGRVPTVTRSQYIGEKGTIFWDELTGELFLSDGVTQGGHDIGLPPASSSRLGGVKLGPGVILNQNGQVIIDSTGLNFSFGDFSSTIGTYTNENEYAILQTINTNEDMVLASNGTGGVHVVGEFTINKTNGNLTDTLEAVPVFQVKADGQVKILVPVIDSVTGAVSIVGSTTGANISPVNTGVMLHVTGNYGSPGIASRIYNDSQNAFGAWVTRRFNGTVASPTAVLANEEIMRLSGTAHNGTTIPGSGNQRIVYVARGNQTTNNQGGAIELWATPINTITIAKIATVDSTGITLESGKVLTGNVTGKADTAGNADTVTNGVYTNGSYANPSWITSLAASKVGLGSVENTALSTSTHYIGTTSIQYNRASASQTLTGVSIDGNAGTVTNGVVTTGSYSDPSWLTISKSKVGLSAVENTALSTWAGSSNITTVGTLTNLSVTNKITGSISGNADGSAGSVAAANITGTTLASNVVTSSLTTVGTLGSLTVTNDSSAKFHTSTAVELGSKNANFNLDLSAGELQRVTVTADVTITVQNPAAGRVTRLVVVYSGNRTVTHGIAAGFTSSKSATQAGNNQIHILEFYQFGTTLATDVYLGIA